MALTRQHRNMMFLVGVLIAVAAAVAGPRFLNDNSEEPDDTELEYVKIVVKSSIKAGEPFTIRYESRDPAQAERLRPSLAMALDLRRGGEKLYTLISDASGDPRAIPVGQEFGLPAVDLIGPTTLRYTLPELDEASYRLCGSVGFDAAGTGQYVRERFCRAVKVVAG